MNGGYSIVDWHGLELTNEGMMIIPYIYRDTKAALETGKMVIVTNCKHNDVVLSPFPVTIKNLTDSLVCTIPNYQITININHTVTVISTIGG